MFYKFLFNTCHVIQLLSVCKVKKHKMNSEILQERKFLEEVEILTPGLSFLWKLTVSYSACVFVNDLNWGSAGHQVPLWKQWCLWFDTLNLLFTTLKTCTNICNWSIKNLKPLEALEICAKRDLDKHQLGVYMYEIIYQGSSLQMATSTELTRSDSTIERLSLNYYK